MLINGKNRHMTRLTQSPAGALAAAALLFSGLYAAAEAKVLDTLIVEGLVINQAAVVRTSAGLKKGAEFTSTDLQDALGNLYRLGLFQSIDLYVAGETDSSVSLLLELKEFPVAEAFEFAGNKKLKVKGLEEKLTIRTGQICTDELLFDNAQTLKKFYAEKGYLLADIEPQTVETKIPGNAIVRFKIKEGSKVKIREIAFTGNAAFKENRLKRKFKTKEERWWRGDEFSEEQYRQNIDSLLLFYNDQGFLDAEVVNDSVRYAENNKDIFITIELFEGRKYFAGDFYFSGNTILATDTLKQKIAMKKGKPFQKSRFELTKYYIGDAYREEGYLWADVRDRKAYRGDTIDVTFEIAEGPAAIVHKVDIRGNAKTLDKVVRREIKLMPGQKYKQSRMARSVRDIMQLNYFNNVSPDMARNDDGTIDLVLDIEEKDNIGQLSVGAAYSQRDQFVGTFSTSIPNFRGHGQELSLAVEYGKNRQDYSVTFKEPYAFDYPVSTLLTVYYNLSRYYGTTESYGFRLGAGRRLSWPDDYFRLDGTYQLSWEDETTNPVSVGPVDVPGEGIMSRLTLTLYRNDTDLPQFPTRGSIFYLIPEIAGLGGKYRYLKSTVSYDWYFPLFWKFVLGTKSKFGLVQPFPGRDKVTISRWDLFNAGGVYTDGTIRGYPDYAFGGRRPGHPESGMTMLVMSTMIQFPILEQQLYLSLFGDMGNTWADITDIDPADMYKGVGAGMRIMIPMLGLMGFDFAWRLDDPNRTQFSNDAGTGADRFEFHFLMNRGF